MGGWDNAPEYGGPNDPWLRNALAFLAVVVLGVTLANCAQEAARDQAESPDAKQTLAEVSGNAVTGRPEVTDGDTLRFGETRVRLSGIDSPERGKFCGQLDIYGTARAALRNLIGQQSVICEPVGEPDQYGREVSRCVAGQVDLNERMVELGMARDWPRYSHGAYADEEATARAGEMGVWSLACPADLWGNREYSPN